MTSEPIEPIATEATGGIFEEVTLALGEDTSEEITTTESSDRPEQTTGVTEDEAETTTAVITQDSTDVEEEEREEKEEKLKEEEDSSNEIDTDGFVVSQDTLESAKKYGYKILLKKVRATTSL